jgi:hypothetical protein
MHDLTRGKVRPVHETGLITLIDNVLYRNLITPRNNRKMQEIATGNRAIRPHPSSRPSSRPFFLTNRLLLGGLNGGCLLYYCLLTRPSDLFPITLSMDTDNQGVGCHQTAKESIIDFHMFRNKKARSCKGRRLLTPHMLCTSV